MSNKKISEESIVDAAQLLRKGAKMLSDYCPDCRFPLFKSEDRIFCPNCEREVKVEKREELERREEIEKPTIERSQLETKLESTIIKVCDLILSSRSVEEIRMLSESLEKLANILDKIRGR